MVLTTEELKLVLVGSAAAFGLMFTIASTLRLFANLQKQKTATAPAKTTQIKVVLPKIQNVNPFYVDKSPSLELALQIFRSLKRQ